MDTNTSRAANPMSQVTRNLAGNVSFFNPATSWSHIFESKDLGP
jgi:hypothetical protein